MRSHSATMPLPDSVKVSPANPGWSVLHPHGLGTGWPRLGGSGDGPTLPTSLKVTSGQPVPRRKGLTQCLPAGIGASSQACPAPCPLPGRKGVVRGASGRAPVSLPAHWHPAGGQIRRCGLHSLLHLPPPPQAGLLSPPCASVSSSDSWTQ